MAVQNLVKQRIGFILADTSQAYDAYDTFMLNNLLQTCRTNSLANAVLSGFDHYNQTLQSANETTYFYLDFLVTAAFQATMQANMATLAAAFSPKYTVFTYGENIAWGF